MADKKVTISIEAKSDVSQVLADAQKAKDALAGLQDASAVAPSEIPDVNTLSRHNTPSAVASGSPPRPHRATGAKSPSLPAPPPVLPGELLEQMGDAGPAFVKAPGAYIKGTPDFYQTLSPPLAHAAHRYAAWAERHYPKGTPRGFEPHVSYGGEILGDAPGVDDDPESRPKISRYESPSMLDSPPDEEEPSPSPEVESNRPRYTPREEKRSNIRYDKKGRPIIVPPAPVIPSQFIDALDRPESFIRSPVGFLADRPDLLGQFDPKIAAAAHKYATWKDKYYGSMNLPGGFEPNVQEYVNGKPRPADEDEDEEDDAPPPRTWWQRQLDKYGIRHAGDTDEEREEKDEAAQDRKEQWKEFNETAAHRDIPGTGWLTRKAYGTGREVVNDAGQLAGITSIMGFLTGSAATYQQLADTLQVLKQRFGEAGDSARLMGYEIGLVGAESAQLMNAIGEQTNTVTRPQFLRIGGFARAFGMDLADAGSTVGSIERLSQGKFFDATAGQVGEARAAGVSSKRIAANIDDVGMLSTKAIAESMGMGGGRFTEYMHTLSQAVSAQFESMGKVDGGAMFATRFGSMVFQNNPAGQGDMGLQFGQKAGRMMSGDTSNAMRIYMMRALGFGGEGGPKYLDMLESMEGGISNPKLAAAMFGSLRAEMGDMPKEEAESRATVKLLSEGKAAGMSVHQLRKFVQFGMSDEGYETLTKHAKNPEEAMSAPFSERLAGYLKGGGLAGAGREAATSADWKQVQFEQVQYDVGKRVTNMMTNLSKAAEAVADIFVDMTNWNPVESLENATEAVRDFATGVRDSKQTMDSAKYAFSPETAGEAWMSGATAMSSNFVESAKNAPFKTYVLALTGVGALVPMLWPDQGGVAGGGGK